MSSQTPSNQPSMVVLISGSGTNLQAIIDAVEAHHIPGKIAAVLSNNADAKGLTRAAEHQIPGIVIDHKAYATREAFDQAMIESIDEYQPELVVLAGFMRILTEGFVNHYSGRLVNIHPSLLPKYKGLNTHQRAIDAGDKEHGTSVHFVTEELDGGPVVLQAKVPVFEDDDADALAARVQTQEHNIYPMVTKWLVDGRLSMTEGKAYLDGFELGAHGYAAE